MSSFCYFGYIIPRIFCLGTWEHVIFLGPIFLCILFLGLFLEFFCSGTHQHVVFLGPFPCVDFDIRALGLILIFSPFFVSYSYLVLSVLGSWVY
jgi:hypothetical protein